MRALLVALAAFSLTLDAQSGPVERGYEFFYNLDFDEALIQFQTAAARDPSSPDYHNHIAETLVFREMFRNGALESELVSGNNSFLRRPKLNPSPETEKQFLAEIDKALALSDARIKANPKDASALYAQGIAYGLRSDYFWVVKKSWRDSLKDATAARRLHNRVSELEPANVDARLVQGLHDYIVGSLPLMYRMLGFLVGIRGDKAQGIRIVQDVARNGIKNRTEAQIFLCALYRREGQPRNAVPIVKELIRRYPRNYLLMLELAQMYSSAGDGATGLQTLADASDLKSKHAAGYDRLPWERIYYQRGTIQFWYRDLDHALENLQRVVGSAEDLDLNTGSYAWLRIGQIYDLTSRRSMALKAYENSIAFAPEGEAAHESKRYLSAPYKRS